MSFAAHIEKRGRGRERERDKSDAAEDRASKETRRGLPPLQQLPACSYLASLDDLEVGEVLKLHVLGSVEVLLGHKHALLEELLVDSLAVGLGNKHGGCKRQKIQERK